ncbi:MAG TPA: hypothetical protein VMI06_14000 [Terriglobia bacterium]|nr:hypothetical protein [Terriglobia bacterium]
MGKGLEAVKHALKQEFEGIEIHEEVDTVNSEFILNFEVETLPYQVRVSMAYDEDYGSGQVDTDLTKLPIMLLRSGSGKVRVFRRGMSSI